MISYRSALCGDAWGVHICPNSGASISEPDTEAAPTVRGALSTRFSGMGAGFRKG